MDYNVYTQDERLNLGLSRFRRSKNFCEPYFDRAKTHYKMFRSYRNKAQHPWQHNVFLPKVFEHASTKIARMIQTLFAVDDLFAFLMNERMDEYVARICERVANQQIGHPKAEALSELEASFQQSCVFGLGYLGLYPQFDSSMNYKYPRCDAPDFFSIYPDPNCKRLSRAGWLVHRTEIDHKELINKMDQGIYKRVNVEEIKKLPQVVDDNEHKNAMQAIGLTTDSGVWTDPSDPKSTLVELLDIYEDGHIMTIAGRSLIIRDTSRDIGSAPFPYKIPVLDNRLWTVAGEYFGIGLPEAMQDVQENINEIMNIFLDNAQFVINRGYIANDTANINLDTFFSAPGIINTVTDINGIKAMDATSQGMELAPLIMDRLTSEAEEITGETRYARGSTPERRETATAIVRLQQMALSLSDLQMKNVEYNVLRKLGKWTIQLVREYTDVDWMVRFINPNPEDPKVMEAIEQLYGMTQEEIDDEVDFKAVGAAVTSTKELRAERSHQIATTLLELPPELTQNNVTPYVIDTEAVIRMWLNALETREVDNIIRLLPKQREGGLPAGQMTGGAPPMEAMAEAAGAGGMMPLGAGLEGGLM